MWTGPDHESYICLTAHWFAPDWQLQHALLDILLCTDRPHRWKSGGVDQASLAREWHLRMIIAAFALLAFSLTVLLSFFSASWCWSSDSWSWRWHIESSATERDPWLSMLWSWTRSDRQCWPWLPHFRSDLHQGFQRGFDHPILQQPLSQVARRSSKEYLYVSSDCVRLHLLSVCVVGDVDRLFCPSCSSNAVCAHSVAVKVWDVEIFTCKQGIREKDVCEWWWLLQCAAWSRLVRRRMANRWGQCLFCSHIGNHLSYGGLDRNHCQFSNA